ncbi:Pre protein translocase subunit Sec66-domain-containing protein [Radiomyces spectabilis]|uniref:Pre protein translocase subunit Sec66-domain-containing protein n=1 Tax=Radiomyces spectabilis TaxID=64574 RepID=UPI00221E886E|nr:Pre protein translocase subunit Sec66-domain-containing protein [Radiomyces spectabilis]KAI8377983.1 Pre protein translocase subunit Sec66-domain-containing protein [Radiomyces spectabilis]
MEAVRRLVQVQQEKPALQQLMRTGSVGDDLWRDFSVAEQEIMHELQETANEANTYKEGWGQSIFSSAAQMLEHEKQKQMQVEMKTLRENEMKRQQVQEQREEREALATEEREKERRAKEAKKAEEALLRMEEEEKKKAAASKGKGKK